MARKNDEESAVSLFSFQDIITSITGIMFLVVLLLVLLMITSRVPSSQPNKENEIVKELQKEAAELQRKLQALRQNRSQLDNQLDELKKLSPEEIARRKAKITNAIVVLESALANQNHSIQEKTAKLNRLETERKDLDKICQQRQILIDDLQKEIKKLENIIQTMQKKQQQRKRLMQFIVHKSSSKSPVLAQLNKDGIRLMDPAVGDLVDLRRPGLIKESLEAFKRELAKFDPAYVYFSIAVTPDGFKHAFAVLDILKNKKFDRGVEVLPDNETSLFEEQTP